MTPSEKERIERSIELCKRAVPCPGIINILYDIEFCYEARNHYQQDLETLLKQAEEIERLRAALELHNTCAVCGCSLLPSNVPPHCETCILEEEDVDEWLQTLKGQQ